MDMKEPRAKPNLLSNTKLDALAEVPSPLGNFWGFGRGQSGLWKQEATWKQMQAITRVSNTHANDIENAQ